ncbi:MAG: ABC transporter ATP-binding protein [Gemmatimonadota bacterium]
MTQTGSADATSIQAVSLFGRGIDYTHPGAGKRAVDGVDVAVRPRRLTTVLGPNGAGKSTLLRILSGALRPDAGSVSLGDAPLHASDDRSRARSIGVVPQSEASPFPVTVRDLVAMGRYPHLGTWERTGVRDRDIVDRALARCGVTAFSDRLLDSLSGGERQRARIARALAQEAPILLLDEPTAGLDLRYRMEVFELVLELCEEGLSVLLVTHDLNLASRYAHEVLLMDRGRTVKSGAPNDVLQREALESVYGWTLRIAPHLGPGPDTGAAQAIPLRRETT